MKDQLERIATSLERIAELLAPRHDYQGMIDKSERQQKMALQLYSLAAEQGKYNLLVSKATSCRHGFSSDLVEAVMACIDPVAVALDILSPQSQAFALRLQTMGLEEMKTAVLDHEARCRGPTLGVVKN